MSNIAIRSASALTVMGLSLGVALVGAPLASATPPSTETPTTTVPVPDSNIKFGKKGSLTVTKHVYDSKKDYDVSTGNPREDVNNPYIDGVKYELYLVQEINNPTAWNAAVEASKAGAAGIDVSSQTPVKTGVTDNGGVIEWTGLELGLYKLVEVPADGSDLSYVNNEENGTLVFLPMTNPDKQTEWNYNVHVYPKNQYDPATPEIEKEVVDADSNVGDTIIYTLKSEVPNVTVTDVTWYQVADQLDTTILDAENAQVSVSLTGIANAPELIENTDYVVTKPGGKVKVTFLAPGLEKLTELRRTTDEVRVQTTIEVLVKQVGEGHVHNVAELYHNNPEVNSTVQPNIDPENPPTDVPDEPETSDPVDSYWANIELNKVDDEGKALKNAEFELYRCSIDGVLEGDALAVDHDNNPETPLRTTLVTNGEGKATFYGLKVTDFENNVRVDPSAYCLVETKAPAGFSLLPEPVPVTLTQAETHGETVSITKVAEVANLPETRGSLPLTGGMGIGFLVALGALIVAVGAYTAQRFGKSA